MRPQQILTTVMKGIVVDKSTDHTKPCSICLTQHQRNLYQELLTIENTELDLKVHACIMQMSYLYASDCPIKTFAKSLNMQKQYERNVWEKSNDAYSMFSKSTDNHKPHFDLFFTTISTSKKMFFQSMSWKRYCATH